MIPHHEQFPEKNNLVDITDALLLMGSHSREKREGGCSKPLPLVPDDDFIPNHGMHPVVIVQE